MKKLGQERYKKAPESTRRKTWANKSAVVASAALALFIIAILVGAFVGPGRECPAGTALESAVCVPCEPARCLECGISGSQKCDKCSDGSLVSKEGKCTSCNTDAADESPCLSCKFQEGSDTATECLSCKSGFRLANGKCYGCGQGSGCATCDKSKCLECKSRYRLSSAGDCELCSSDLRYCAQCKDTTSCEVCDLEVAQLKDGKCTECRTDNAWFKSKTVPG